MKLQHISIKAQYDRIIAVMGKVFHERSEQIYLHTYEFATSLLKDIGLKLKTYYFVKQYIIPNDLQVVFKHYNSS